MDSHEPKMPNFPRRSDIHRRSQEASSKDAAASEAPKDSASSKTPPSARPHAHSAGAATPRHSGKTAKPARNADVANGHDEAPAAKDAQTPGQPTSARPGLAFRPVRKEAATPKADEGAPRDEFGAILSGKSPAEKAPASRAKKTDPGKTDAAQADSTKPESATGESLKAGESKTALAESTPRTPIERSSCHKAPASQSASSVASKTSAPERPARTDEDDDDFLATTGIRSRRLEQERERARRRSRSRRIRRFFVALVIVLISLSLLGVASYFALQTLSVGSSQSQQADDYSGPGGPPVTVTIYKGALGSDIGKILVENDVVKSEAAFVRAFEANKASNSIRPGTYTLKSQISASDAVAALLDDKNRSENNVTVIPGDTVAQVVQRMKAVTEFDAAAVDAAVANTTALGLPPEAGGKLEGWLAPGTYELSADATPEALLKDMVAERIKELDALKIAPADRQTILIKASILEREVDRDEYLPKVARVIDNRLADPTGETRGLLQMDSTVAYAVGRTSGVPTAAELAFDSPYNTYKVKGLPAGAISNPHVKAIEATLKPEQGSWLYFVTINLDTGETRFSSTLAEHEQAKALLDEYCATHGSKCHK